MKKNNNLLKSLIAVFVMMFICLNVVFASGLDVPRMEDAVRIKSGTSYKSVEFGKYKWILKETGRWALNLDMSNPYLFASDGFFAVPFIDNGKFDYGFYYFDEVGSMITGWAKDGDGNYYYFDYGDQVGSLGRMCAGWRNIGDGWFYFGGDGKLLVNQMTPDGYKVGIDGNMVDINNKTSKHSKDYGKIGQ